MKLSTLAIAGALFVGSVAAFAPVPHANNVGVANVSSSSFSAKSSTALNMAKDDPMAYAKDLIQSNDVMVRRFNLKLETTRLFCLLTFDLP